IWHNPCTIIQPREESRSNSLQQNQQAPMEITTMLRRAPVPILLLGATLAPPALATDLTAIADTYIQSDSPTSNFGSNAITAVASNRITLIRFDAAQIAQSSGTRATLKIKLLLAKNSQDGVSARLVSGAWDEKSVTAKTLPPISTAALDGQVISRT